MYINVLIFIYKCMNATAQACVESGAPLLLHACGDVVPHPWICAVLEHRSLQNHWYRDTPSLLERTPFSFIFCLDPRPAQDIVSGTTHAYPHIYVVPNMETERLCALIENCSRFVSKSCQKSPQSKQNRSQTVRAGIYQSRENHRRLFQNRLKIGPKESPNGPKGTPNGQKSALGDPPGRPGDPRTEIDGKWSKK